MVDKKKIKRIDERDTMFARAAYKVGEENYKDYYLRNPDKKELDDHIREKPGLCAPESKFYDPVNVPMAEAPFMFLNDIRKLCMDTPLGEKIEVDTGDITKKIKGYAKYYGAKLVGITQLEKYHYYTHRGRHQEDYGKKVDRHHKYGIVFAVEMDQEMITHAPAMPEIIATAKGYVDAAMIGMVLSYYIRRLGYEALNHMDGNYLVIAPLIARDGGLGQIGRNGLLTTQEFGSRVRLGVVTTDLELIADAISDYGLEDFCEICNLCSKFCPGKAIPKEKSMEDGHARWQVNQEKCYEKWCDLGTDCGICIANCPFSSGLEYLSKIDTFKNNDHLIRQILDEYQSKFFSKRWKEKPDWL